MKMPRFVFSKRKYFAPFFGNIRKPLAPILPESPILESRGNRPLQMTFEDQLDALIFFHLEEHTSARHLIQTLREDEFARNNVVPPRVASAGVHFQRPLMNVA